MELYHRYEFRPQVGLISNYGRHLISELIQLENLGDKDWRQANPTISHNHLPSLPNDWHWLWLTERGTFPKRVSRFYHNIHNIKTPPSFKQRLGDYARSHSETRAIYRFEFADEIDWNAGDFGDRNSCYWGEYEEARFAINRSDTLAVKFFDQNNTGIARAWMSPSSEAEHVIWNGYGFDNATLTIARVISQWLGMDYQHAYITNTGENSDTVYINNRQGFALGKIEDERRRVYIEIDAAHRYVCYNCDDGISEDNYYITPSDEIYCESCFHETADHCSNCGEAAWLDEAYYVGDYPELYCQYCYERNCGMCDICGRDYLLDNLHYNEEKEQTVCEDCLD